MRKLVLTIIAAVAGAAFLAAWSPAARADVSYYTPPKFKNKVLPIYPDSARAAHETGSVLIKVLVDASGHPKQFIIFKSSGHKDLDNSVLAAAKASTYQAAMRGSSPTMGFYDVTYKFTLSGVSENEGNQSGLSKKLESNPKDVATRLQLGTDFLNQKNYGQAEQLFQTGTQLVPQNPKLWAYLGLSYFQDAQSSNDASKYKPAVDAYDQAIKLDSKVDKNTGNVAAAAYFNYGFHLQQANQTAQALPYAQKAVSLEPKTSAYYILMGELQTAQGDYTNAINTLKQAVQFDDKKSTIVTSRMIADLANAELSQGDKADGMADINRAEQINGQAPFAFEYLYSYYVKSKQPAAALTPLNQLATLLPKDPTWQLQIGRIYLSLNNIVAAREAFQKAQAIAPSNYDAQCGMAEVSAVNGDTASVSSAMQKFAANPDAKVAAECEASVAGWLINAGQSGKKSYAADAQKYASQATKADPTNGNAWFVLGVADSEVKPPNRDEASAALKKAYDIFTAQHDQDMLKQVNDLYKQLNGTTLGGS